MIAAVRGELIALSSARCVVDAGGVGYAVTLTPAHARQLAVGQEVTLVTTLVVREDSMQLFGFETHVAQELFDSLLGVSGVGPRSAMAVLSELDPAEIYSAVSLEDDAIFRRVPGIGPKTAKLIVVSLTGRLGDLAMPAPTGSSSSARADGREPTPAESVTRALVGLGWNERVAREAVASASSHTPDADASTILRDTLASLASYRDRT